MGEVATRTLGRTGLTVTELCLGTSPLASMPYLYGHEVDEDRAVDTVLATLDSPIRFIDTSNNYGEQTEHFDGVNITLNARLQNGLLVQGGLGTGRRSRNDCEVVDELPEMLHTCFGDPTRVLLRSTARRTVRAERRVPDIGAGSGRLHAFED